jgi:hypothetical protein
MIRENSKAVSVMLSKAQERANRLFKWKQDGVTAASEYGVKEQATRLLTAKLRAERLAREAMGKRDQKRSTKAQAKNPSLCDPAFGETKSR